MNDNLEPNSNVMDESEIHIVKHWRSSFSTDGGIEMVKSDRQFSNALRSTDSNLDPGSNITFKISERSAKQPLPQCSIFFGIHTICDEPKYRMIRIPSKS
jgi:hypothetical protein